MGPQTRHAELAQRLARHAMRMTIVGMVTAGLGLILLLAEMHPTSIAPFLLLLFGLSTLLVAPMLGAVALMVRGATKTPGVVGGAVLALCVGAAAFLLSLLVAFGLSGFEP